MIARRFGQWAGNPKGTAEDTTRCLRSVMSGMLFYQCSRKRGYGERGMFCKQHAKSLSREHQLDIIQGG